ncbi:Protein RMD5 A [Orchesella cincta]|uniref:Protein RMD5 A n=1 Tax=Orchesella cincta TaxID=48709 RepID=A0A1D2MJ62_ORCCI|nr:Protein RMD5 A [Orchesella cincta]
MAYYGTWICLAVEMEVDNVTRRLDSIRSDSSEELQQHQLKLNDIMCLLKHQSDDDELDDVNIENISAAVKEAVACADGISTQHRLQHINVSKVGKAIDKNFSQVGVGPLSEDGFFKDEKDKRALVEVIGDHLLREGKLGIGEKMCEESGQKPKLNTSLPDVFLQLNGILKALNARDVNPALNWVGENREALLKQGSTLEFQLHRLAFLTLVKNGDSLQADAMVYGRANFPRFAKLHEKEIQGLMTALLYFSTGSMKSSPYTHWFNEKCWDDIRDQFAREASALLAVPIESPLETCCSAGCVALPILLEVSRAMAQARQGQSQAPQGNTWNGRNELPVEIKLDKDFHFHSIFSCPILRQQTSEANPPMRLNCGHVISKDAIQKLMRGQRFKCPYCTGAQNLQEAKQINF